MHSHHGHVFVLLSYAVAAFAAWTALDLFGRVRDRDGGERMRWLAVAALAMGGGVWSMHFIAMLGFDPGAPVSYEPGLTALSFLLAVIGTGAAFFAASRPGLGLVRLPLSAVAMGGAIAAMHYVGMAAMRTTATVGWKPPLVVLSVAIAIAASFAALWASKRETSALWRLGAAAVLAGAVVGMHYAGMAALVLAPTAAAAGGGASPLALAVGVAAVTASILFMALGASIADQKSRLLDVIEAGGVGYWELSLKDRTVRFSERGRELLGLPPGTGGYPVDDPQGLQAEDLARRNAALQRALAGEAPYDVEYFFPASGRWVQAYGSLVRTRSGRPFKLAGVVRDVTDRRRAFDELETSERRQKLLINELNHRVKNTLATVQSIAALTARRATSVEEFGAQFQARLMALSETHNLLTAQGWEQATLRDLIAKEMRPYSPDQFRLQGPDVMMAAPQALAMGMIIHELATNAAKHGALSVDGGSVVVAWSEPGADGRHSLDWIERDGPAVSAPTRNGFGSRLIATSVKGDLDGEAEMDWLKTGLHARLTFRAAGR
ncbi:MAG: PAS domain-containing protein [Alphaproteobacteria bacterium]|nr:PAS domain-containing protein [Alphaproteobacteria bacterium]MBU1527067.1 PAS domain-containing protein [Alphaproteobacteria bacterium]MBU2115964.1 PAS domain-containing protein [Alphaproteobacteria bacterium]MBU2350007.1 PAS domain-containing protein [Alphaproteobacteria bacterium]MBU2383566.1 PAS domain-containing protein [Alphaproteobacteria bacterium]